MLGAAGAAGVVKHTDQTFRFCARVIQDQEADSVICIHKALLRTLSVPFGHLMRLGAPIVGKVLQAGILSTHRPGQLRILPKTTVGSIRCVKLCDKTITVRQSDTCLAAHPFVFHGQSKSSLTSSVGWILTRLR